VSDPVTRTTTQASQYPGLAAAKAGIAVTTDDGSGTGAIIMQPGDGSQATTIPITPGTTTLSPEALGARSPDALSQLATPDKEKDDSTIFMTAPGLTLVAFDPESGVEVEGLTQPGGRFPGAVGDDGDPRRLHPPGVAASPGVHRHQVRPGFEMLADNFSAGIFAALGAIGSMFLLTPVMNVFMTIAGNAVEFLVNNNVLFLTSVLIEPAKVLFLNNAINHGVLTPLATDQAVETGKSVLYLLEANPGPGLGVLLAYTFFGRGSARATAPGASIIHFFGGIHEIYFPYVLMKPALILAPICGGMTGVLIETISGAGLRSPAAPGSIIAILGATASDSYVGVIAGVTGAAIVSFLVASAILKFSKHTDDDLAAATARMEEMKGKKSSIGAALTGESTETPLISTIVFACDAGMGSSAMGASVLRNKIKDAGYGNDVSVVNSAINNLTDTYDLLVCHEDLFDRAKAPTPSAVHVTVDNFMASPRYDEIVDLIRSQREATAATATTEASTSSEGDDAAPTADKSEKKPLLVADNIVLAGTATTRYAAISEAGELLVKVGAVDESYIDAMHEREQSVSTFMGNGLAIPHGTNESKDAIKGSAISFIRYEKPVDWGGQPTYFVVGIAGADGSHLKVLSKIAKIFGRNESVEQLKNAATKEEILEIFGKVTE